MSLRTITATVCAIAALIGAIAMADPQLDMGNDGMPIFAFLPILGGAIGIGAVASQRPMKWNFIAVFATAMIAFIES